MSENKIKGVSGCFVICDVQEEYSDHLFQILSEQFEGEYQFHLFHDLQKMTGFFAKNSAEILVIGEEYGNEAIQKAGALQKFILTGSPGERKDTEDILLFGHTNLETNAAMELNVNLYTKQFMYEWYIPFFEDFLLPYVQENNLTKTQQRYIVYFIMLRFYLNTNERNKHILENEQVDRFFDLVRKAICPV